MTESDRARARACSLCRRYYLNKVSKNAFVTFNKLTRRIVLFIIRRHCIVDHFHLGPSHAQFLLLLIMELNAILRWDNVIPQFVLVDVELCDFERGQDLVGLSGWRVLCRFRSRQNQVDVALFVKVLKPRTNHKNSPGSAASSSVSLKRSSAPNFKICSISSLLNGIAFVWSLFSWPPPFDRTVRPEVSIR